MLKILMESTEKALQRTEQSVEKLTGMKNAVER